MAGAKRTMFTKRVRETFLAHLAATANVHASAAAAGAGYTTVYRHRQRDPAFAFAWRMALLAGYDRIELALIRKALGLKTPMRDRDIAAKAQADGLEEETGELDVELALKLLTRHKPVVTHAEAEVKAGAFRTSRDAAEASLLAKLKAHAKRQDVLEYAEAASTQGSPATLVRLTEDAGEA